MKVEHALELLETQGIKQLSEYLKKIREESLNSTVKAVKNLVIDSNFKAAHFLTEDLLQKNVQHPKLPKLREIVQEEMQRNPEAKLIIFTQYRDSAEEVVKELSQKGIIQSKKFTWHKTADETMDVYKTRADKCW